MKKSAKLLSLLLSASLASQMISSVNINATKDSITFYDVKNNILDLKAYDAELDTNHDGNMNVFDVIRANKTLIQEESYTDLKEKVYMLETQIESLYQKLNEKTDSEEGKQLSSNDYTDEEKQKLENMNNYDDAEIKTEISELSIDLSSKVDKEEGKQLSSNDYTDEEKQKLEGLYNYDDTKINEKIDSLVQTAYQEKKSIESSIENKVDKEEGKQLSSNDYTDEEKQKLESLHNYDDTNLKNEIEEISKITSGTSFTDNLYACFDKVGCVGDSLSSGECVDKYYDNDGSQKYEFIDFYQYSWGQFMARKSGNTYYNFSKGGLTTRTWLDYSGGKALATDGNHNCKAYIIGLGANDMELGTDYVGSISDIKTDYNQNADTFYGNYGKIISILKEQVNGCKIFVLTMPTYEDSAYRPKKALINSAIRDIANTTNDVYLIDLEQEYFDEYNSGLIEEMSRISHYNAYSYNIMGEIISKSINKIMVERSQEFKFIEYIGRDDYFQIVSDNS